MHLIAYIQHMHDQLITTALHDNATRFPEDLSRMLTAKLPNPDAGKPTRSNFYANLTCETKSFNLRVLIASWLLAVSSLCAVYK